MFYDFNVYSWLGLTKRELCSYISRFVSFSAMLGYDQNFPMAPSKKPLPSTEISERKSVSEDLFNLNLEDFLDEDGKMGNQKQATFSNSTSKNESFSSFLHQSLQTSKTDRKLQINNSKDEDYLSTKERKKKIVLDENENKNNNAFGDAKQLMADLNISSGQDDFNYYLGFDNNELVFSVSTPSAALQYSSLFGPEDNCDVGVEGWLSRAGTSLVYVYNAVMQKYSCISPYTNALLQVLKGYHQPVLPSISQFLLPRIVEQADEYLSSEDKAFCIRRQNIRLSHIVHFESNDWKGWRNRVAESSADIVQMDDALQRLLNPTIHLLYHRNHQAHEQLQKKQANVFVSTSIDDNPQWLCDMSILTIASLVKSDFCALLLERDGEDWKDTNKSFLLNNVDSSSRRAPVQCSVDKALAATVKAFVVVQDAILGYHKYMSKKGQLQLFPFLLPRLRRVCEFRLSRWIANQKEKMIRMIRSFIAHDNMSNPVKLYDAYMASLKLYSSSSSSSLISSSTKSSFSPTNSQSAVDVMSVLSAMTEAYFSTLEMLSPFGMETISKFIDLLVDSIDLYGKVRIQTLIMFTSSC